MSKVYVLTATYCEDSFTEGVFSSYASMLTYLREKYEYTSKVTYRHGRDSGRFVDKSDLGHGIAQWELSFNIHDLIGETYHKTDKLVL